jgi:redox-sensitive bicupin YhaK (pirin superfamily)
VHSERTPPEQRAIGSELAGLQCWVALPRADEESEPDFVHVGADELPVHEAEGVHARVVAGEFFGRRSPVPVRSPLCYVDIALEPGARMELPAVYAEQALYGVEGEIDLGRDGVFEAGRLIVIKPGATITLAAGRAQAARVMLLGGEPLEGPRYINWNFVASSAERIEQARNDWREGRFAQVPGEHEFIPLPDTPGKPVHYP